MRVGYVVPVLVVAAALGGYGLRGGDAVAVEPCVVAARPGATPEANGFRIVGDAGSTVSEAFTLPEGTVVWDLTIAGDAPQVVTLQPAPGSAGEGIEAMVAGGGGDRTKSGATRIGAAGEFVLEVTSNGPWSVVFQTGSRPHR